MADRPGDLDEDELAIATAFGKGEDLDIGEETMDFDIASFIGKNVSEKVNTHFKRHWWPTPPPPGPHKDSWSLGGFFLKI